MGNHEPNITGPCALCRKRRRLYEVRERGKNNIWLCGECKGAGKIKIVSCGLIFNT